MTSRAYYDRKFPIYDIALRHVRRLCQCHVLWSVIVVQYEYFANLSKQEFRLCITSGASAEFLSERPGFFKQFFFSHYYYWKWFSLSADRAQPTKIPRIRFDRTINTEKTEKKKKRPDAYNVNIIPIITGNYVFWFGRGRRKKNFKKLTGGFSCVGLLRHPSDVRYNIVKKSKGYFCYVYYFYYYWYARKLDVSNSSVEL